MCEVERRLVKLDQSQGPKGLLLGQTGRLQYQQ